VDLAVLETVCVIGVLAVPKRYATLRLGLAMYGAAAFVVFVIPNPLGGNFERAVLYFAPALFAFLATIPRRRALALLVVPLLLWQYIPASSAFANDPSAEKHYFTPLVDYLSRESTLGRVEIPFTRAHWEAAYVAPRIPLARGWLRQLDIRDNPVFYSPRLLTPTTYHRWLIQNGVTWVALPDVALDYSAVHEAHLLKRGLPYLHVVWHDPHWTVWKVTDSPGLVSGPARITALGPDGIALDATRAGTALLRVHYTPTWAISSGHACIQNRDGWTELVIRQAGHIDLTTSLFSTNGRC
jgi:hypothetical protein